MNNIISIFNEFLCAFNEIVWPSSTFFIWMVSIMYVYKKKGREQEYSLALFVFSVFVTYVTFCFYQRKNIGVSIHLSAGLICGSLFLFFLFDKKKQKNIDETGMENVSADTNTKEKILGKKKKGKKIDPRTFDDFVIGKDIHDKTAYIQQLQDLMEGRKGQKALDEIFLKEFKDKNISKDISFRAFDKAFPNVIDEPGFSRFKQKIPSDFTPIKY